MASFSMYSQTGLSEVLQTRIAVPEPKGDADTGAVVVNDDCNDNVPVPGTDDVDIGPDPDWVREVPSNEEV